jgi:hypothetical protein
MKTLAMIIAMILLTITTGFAKKNAKTIDQVHYGAALSQNNNGTGQSKGYTINANVVKGRKSLELGIIYSERESKFAGGDFKYRIFLGNIRRIEDVNKIYKPYLQYNLIYQKGTSYTPDLINLDNATYEVPAEPGVVSTIGHFLAYGNKVKLFGNAYLDSSLGLGIYRGSLNKINGPDTWGVHGTNTGFTYSFKIGFGYTFN